jgi:hypothetical protein
VVVLILRIHGHAFALYSISSLIPATCASNTIENGVYSVLVPHEEVTRKPKSEPQTKLTGAHLHKENKQKYIAVYPCH